MCPPAASPASKIDLYYGDKVIYMLLEGIPNGTPLPSNVIQGENPYQYQPSNLPDGFWFLIRSKVKKDTDFGYWRTKGLDSQIFSNSSITGWRSTLEFFEGQAPLGNKTNWVMQEYWITRKILSKVIDEKEICLLCNVFLVDENKPNNEKPPKMMAQAVTDGQLTQSVGLHNELGNGSTSKSQMGEVNVTRSNVSVTVTSPRDNADIVPEVDYFHGGDFLELLDLGIPASPSSSSDSSCVTMSSDECFDALDSMQDLKSDENHDLAQSNPGSDCKLSVFEPSKPTEMVMNPASTGTIYKSPNEEEPEINTRVLDKVKNPSETQKPDSGNKETPSTSRNQVVADEDGKSPPGRKKKLKKKYLCFMSF